MSLAADHPDCPTCVKMVEIFGDETYACERFHQGSNPVFSGTQPNEINEPVSVYIGDAIAEADYKYDLMGNSEMARQSAARNMVLGNRAALLRVVSGEVITAERKALLEMVSKECSFPSQAGCPDHVQAAWTCAPCFARRICGDQENDYE